MTHDLPQPLGATSRRWPWVLIAALTLLGGTAIAVIALRDPSHEVLGANVWDVLTSLGTLLAVVVAVSVAVVESRRNRDSQIELGRLASKSAQDERSRVARRVVGAVEQSYVPSADRATYIRRATLTLANDSDEPIFSIHVQVAKGYPPVPVGPLAAPERIPVVPARSRQTWDVSLPLLAVSDTLTTLGSPPTVSIEFTDARGVRWYRDYDGSIREAEIAPRRVLTFPEGAEAQLGDPSNPFNPMPTALTFLSTLQQDPLPPPEAFDPLLSPTASGWSEMSAEAWTRITESVRGHGVAAHVWYPAPQVARVRTLNTDQAENRPAPRDASRRRTGLDARL